MQVEGVRYDETDPWWAALGSPEAHRAQTSAGIQRVNQWATGVWVALRYRARDLHREVACGRMSLIAAEEELARRDAYRNATNRPAT